MRFLGKRSCRTLHTNTHWKAYFQRRIMKVGGLSLAHFFFVRLHRVPSITSLTATCYGVLTPRDKEKERACACAYVCVRHTVQRQHCLSLPCCMHPGRKCQTGVKLSGWSSCRMMEPWSDLEKCLRPLVVPQHSSCSHRWRATYNQQEAFWLLPYISLSLSPPFFFLSSSLSFISSMWLFQVRCFAVKRVHFFQIRCGEQGAKPHGSQTLQEINHIQFHLSCSSSFEQQTSRKV